MGNQHLPLLLIESNGISTATFVVFCKNYHYTPNTSVISKNVQVVNFFPFYNLVDVMMKIITSTHKQAG